VNGHQIVTFHQHVPTPLADSDHEELDLEIGRRLPLAEDLKNSLLGVLVLDGRTLWPFESTERRCAAAAVGTNTPSLLRKPAIYELLINTFDSAAQKRAESRRDLTRARLRDEIGAGVTDVYTSRQHDDRLTASTVL
jgi:hypothetical protein